MWKYLSGLHCQILTVSSSDIITSLRWCWSLCLWVYVFVSSTFVCYWFEFFMYLRWEYALCAFFLQFYWIIRCDWAKSKHELRSQTRLPSTNLTSSYLTCVGLTYPWLTRVGHGHDRTLSKQVSDMPKYTCPILVVIYFFLSGHILYSIGHFGATRGKCSRMR